MKAFRIILFASGGILSMAVTGLMLYRLAFNNGLLFAFHPIMQATRQDPVAALRNGY